MQPSKSASEGLSLWIPHGMIGFPGLTRYRLVRPSEGNPFSLLVSEEKPQIRFSLMDPLLIRPDYQPRISAGALEELELREAGETYVVVNTPDDARGMTANMRAPFLVNEQSGIGAQILLEDEDLPVRALLVEEWEREQVELLTV
ncbi:MAG: flagellar assembly protein FliW [Candidatus Eisenbacteria bacterium]|nr:flagellar assembly protein FliW [Candidatus Eisenbacteria bacterium]